MIIRRVDILTCTNGEDDGMRLAGFYHPDQGVQVAHASSGSVIGRDDRPRRVAMPGHKDGESPIPLAPETARYCIDIASEPTAADIDRTGIELPETLFQFPLMPGK